jgi:hypothetical protein
MVKSALHQCPSCLLEQDQLRSLAYRILSRARCLQQLLTENAPLSNANTRS